MSHRQPSGLKSRHTAHPENLHVSEVALGRIRLKERMEQKYFVLPQQAGLAIALLRRTCRYDQVFPQEQINSLYFDTWDLDQHERSSSGEYVKDKVRIRWYGSELDPVWTKVGGHADDAQECEGVTVWLELKSRQGFASTKQRIALQIPSERLSLHALGQGIVPWRVLTETMAAFGFYPPSRLIPVVLISYWRHRFVEPFTGFRVSLDSRIRSTMVMPGHGQGELGLELPGMVVEVKGPTSDLPGSLRGLQNLGSSWTRFSKYSSSLEAHISDIGSVSRLWPTGMMAIAPGSPVRLGRLGDRQQESMGRHLVSGPILGTET